MDFQEETVSKFCRLNIMDRSDDTNGLAALKQSILESEIALRELKETIETVNSRLRHPRTITPTPDESEVGRYLNAAGGGG